MFSTAGRWALQEHGPSHPGGRAQPPRPSLTSISFPSFLGEPGSPPRARLSYFPEPRQVAGPSLRPSDHVGPAAAMRSRPAAASLHAPFFLLAPAGRSCVLKPGFRRGSTRWGRCGFLLRASKEHYGWARSRLRPPAPASRVRSGDWRRRRGRDRERGGTRPPARPRPDRRRRLSSHGRAPRLRPEDQQVNLGRVARRRSQRKSQRVLPGPA